MIRSSAHSLKFTNAGKLKDLETFVKNYREMVGKYIGIIWHKQLCQSFLDNKICQEITTNRNCDSLIRQCAAKQACGIVAGSLSKHRKRLYKLKELQKEGKNTKYLQRKISLNPPVKPTCENINVELDSRFSDIQRTPDGYFDLFVKIKYVGNQSKIKLPIKHTKTSNKWRAKGKIKKSIRLSEDTLWLFYEVEQTKRTEGKILGADQGKITCLSLSDGQVTKTNEHVQDLNSIIDKLSRCKKGSKGFRRAQAHRTNYINWSIKQLNLDGVKKVKLEKVLNLRKGKSCSRNLSHWTYTEIKDKLVYRSEEEGFEVVENENKFMSQRCSQCGWTHKQNRKGKTFRCLNAGCGFNADSDLNAASNHEVELIELPNEVWYKHTNRTTGFFWLSDKWFLATSM